MGMKSQNVEKSSVKNKIYTKRKYNLFYFMSKLQAFRRAVQ